MFNGIVRWIKYAFSKPPKGYRFVGKNEILKPGCHVQMDLRSGRNYVKIERGDND